MTYKVQTSNQPVDEHGNAIGDLVEIDDREYIDLQRQGLLVAGKGDLNDKGELKQQIARQAPQEVRQATGPAPVITNTLEG